MQTKDYYYTNLNRVLQYIDDHLEEHLHLTLLAKISHFSPFHFQRIFKALVTENPYEYILRKRLEKAVFLLKHNKVLSITEIAYASGFPSPENFSRQFKQRFGVTASALRKDKEMQKSKIYQEQNENSFYLVYQESRKMDIPAFEVNVTDEVAIPIAFLRALFGEDGSGLVESYHELINWATSAGMTTEDLERYGMSVDDPEVTPSQKYRYDFALANRSALPPSGKVETGTIPGGKYAWIHCQGDIHRVAQAWDYLYKAWLPKSDYVPRHFPAVEAFMRGPEEIGWDQFDLKCMIPIEKITSLI